MESLPATNPTLSHWLALLLAVQVPTSDLLLSFTLAGGDARLTEMRHNHATIKTQNEQE